MSSDRYTLRAAVYIIVIKDNAVLLLRRHNTDWKNGWYTLPAGHLENNETILECACREAKEEAGIEIDQNKLKLVHIVHYRGKEHYIEFYFTASHWKGDPFLAEPEKCDDLGWFPLTNLPDKTLKNVVQAIGQLNQGNLLSEYIESTIRSKTDMTR